MQRAVRSASGGLRASIESCPGNHGSVCTAWTTVHIDETETCQLGNRCPGGTHVLSMAEECAAFDGEQEACAHCRELPGVAGDDGGDDETPAPDAIGWCHGCGTWQRGRAAVLDSGYWEPGGAWMCVSCNSEPWSMGAIWTSDGRRMTCACAGEHADAQIVTIQALCPDGAD